MNILEGKKTYIVALVSIVYAAAGAFLGYHDWQYAIMVILGALGLAGLRHGVTTRA